MILPRELSEKIRKTAKNRLLINKTTFDLQLAVYRCFYVLLRPRGLLLGAASDMLKESTKTFVNTYFINV